MVYNTYTLWQNKLLRYTKNTVNLASVIGDKELYMYIYLQRAHYHVLMQGCRVVYTLGGETSPSNSKTSPAKRSMVTDCNIKEVLVHQK